MKEKKIQSRNNKIIVSSILVLRINKYDRLFFEK